MNPKADRITFHGKGCDYEFGVSTSLLPESVARREYLDLCKAEWDAMNTWAISHNILGMRKYGILKGEEDGQE
jgi:hypothetical protein